MEQNVPLVQHSDDLRLISACNATAQHPWHCCQKEPNTGHPQALAAARIRWLSGSRDPIKLLYRRCPVTALPRPASATVSLLHSFAKVYRAGTLYKGG